MKDFTWTEECQKVFEDLKLYLSSPPLLIKPNTGKELLMYLTTTFEATSSMLVQEEDKVQKSIYYISQILHGAETRYFWIEKIIFTIVMTIRWLCPYIQAHSVKSLIDLPLRTLLQRLDTLGRMAKWIVELSEFDLSYVSRSSMKAQILTDFVVECTSTDDNEIKEQLKEETLKPTWILYVDGASNA